MCCCQNSPSLLFTDTTFTCNLWIRKCNLLGSQSNQGNEMIMVFIPGYAQANSATAVFDCVLVSLWRTKETFDLEGCAFIPHQGNPVSTVLPHPSHCHAQSRILFCTLYSRFCLDSSLSWPSCVNFDLLLKNTIIQLSLVLSGSRWCWHCHHAHHWNLLETRSW